jgi:hypothetical protein
MMSGAGAAHRAPPARAFLRARALREGKAAERPPAV